MTENATLQSKAFSAALLFISGLQRLLTSLSPALVSTPLPAELHRGGYTTSEVNMHLKVLIVLVKRFHSFQCCLSLPCTTRAEQWASQFLKTHLPPVCRRSKPCRDRAGLFSPPVLL